MLGNWKDTVCYKMLKAFYIREGFKKKLGGGRDQLQAGHHVILRGGTIIHIFNSLQKYMGACEWLRMILSLRKMTIGNWVKLLA